MNPKWFTSMCSGFGFHASVHWLAVYFGLLFFLVPGRGPKEKWMKWNVWNSPLQCCHLVAVSRRWFTLEASADTFCIRPAITTDMALLPLAALTVVLIVLLWAATNWHISDYWSIFFHSLINHFVFKLWECSERCSLRFPTNPHDVFRSFFSLTTFVYDKEKLKS